MDDLGYGLRKLVRNPGPLREAILKEVATTVTKRELEIAIGLLIKIRDKDLKKPKYRYETVTVSGGYYPRWVTRLALWLSGG